MASKTKRLDQTFLPKSVEYSFVCLCAIMLSWSVHVEVSVDVDTLNMSRIAFLKGVSILLPVPYVLFLFACLLSFCLPVSFAFDYL